MKVFGKIRLLMFFVTSIVLSQSDTSFNMLQNGNFLGRIISLESNAENKINYQTLAAAYSLVGDNINALKFFTLDNHATEYLLELIDLYNDKNVTHELLDINLLKKMYEDVDMILINEAHHMSLHRKYLIENLNELFSLGYRYLFIEALTNFKNPKINQRGIPHLDDIGIYKDPLFGNMIREALSCGFLVFAYEPGYRNLSFEERELGMAENIMKILDTLPKAKSIVHGGYTHIATQNNFNDTKLMGMHLKENFKVLSIDQTVHCENTSKEYETDFYRTKSQTIENVTFYKNIGKESYYDISLLHPRTKYIGNKPNWLIDNKNLRQINIDFLIPENTKKILVQIFRNYEFEVLNNKAFPIYQFIEEVTADCILPFYYNNAKDDLLVIRDAEGNILFKSLINDL